MMSAPALQLSTSDSMFVVMVIVAASFLVIAAAMVAIAVAVFRVVRTVNNLERRGEPPLERVGALRELAALLAGVRRGLEVLAAPAPKQIDQTYGEEEMFIG